MFIVCIHTYMWIYLVYTYCVFVCRKSGLPAGCCDKKDEKTYTSAAILLYVSTLFISLHFWLHCFLCLAQSHWISLERAHCSFIWFLDWQVYIYIYIGILYIYIISRYVYIELPPVCVSSVHCHYLRYLPICLSNMIHDTHDYARVLKIASRSSTLFESQSRVQQDKSPSSMASSPRHFCN